MPAFGAGFSSAFDADSLSPPNSGTGKVRSPAFRAYGFIGPGGFDFVTEGDAHTLAIQDATHAHTVDNVTLAQNHVLVVQDSTHAHTADSATVYPDISATDATHAHTADNVTLVQIHILAIENASHTHIGENATLSSNAPFLSAPVFSNVSDTTATVGCTVTFS